MAKKSIQNECVSNIRDLWTLKEKVNGWSKDKLEHRIHIRNIIYDV